MDTDEISYFLSLPDQVLLDVVFPRLSYKEIGILCRVHSKFNDICNNDQMWFLKVQIDYPNYWRYKPEYIFWRNYYEYLLNSKSIPVYLDGNIIGHVKYDSGRPLLTVEFLNKFEKEGHSAIYVDKNIEPLWRKPYDEYIVYRLTPEDTDVSKIMIINDMYWLAPENDNIEVSREIIYNNFISGNPPIYGSILGGVFRIIIVKNGQPNSILGKECLEYSFGSMFRFLDILGVFPPGSSKEGTLEEYIMFIRDNPSWFLHDVFDIDDIIRITRDFNSGIIVSQSDNDKYDRWYNEVKRFLCTPLKNKLEDIGHVLDFDYGSRLDYHFV